MTFSLPTFSTIEPKTIPALLDTLLKANLEKIEAILTSHSHFNWENLIQPLDDMEEALTLFWTPVSHLHAVVNSPELRECYESSLAKLSAYEAAVTQNKALYNAIKSIDKSQLNSTQQKIIADNLQAFELSAVNLEREQKQRFEAIQTRLSFLSNQFENNVLDASQAFSLIIRDKNRLQGLPSHAVETAKALATEQNVEGWVFNLEFPCYHALITYADERSLREEIYHAYLTRASEVGPSGGQFDNTPIIDEILALRHEEAQLLGFANYAELSLATKMADSTTQVIDFLLALSTKAHAQAVQEYKELQKFAAENYQLKTLAPWDIAYISEKKRQLHYAISEEELRPYFPLPKVMSGLFTIINKLYGMSVEEIEKFDSWHPDVQCYQLTDEANEIRGYIYIDLFARQQKRSGAWMNSCQSRRRLSDGSLQLPVAFLTCNFAKPARNQTPTLSHEEVLALFHEFGHCLHHVLTKVEYLGASGLNAVEWDAVELPSQFFENWCWEEPALQLLTEHVTNATVLPTHLFQKLQAAKNFQSALAMMRQLEFSLFDFRLHQANHPSKTQTAATILAEVRQQTAITPIAAYNRFQHSFTHIFSGGYGAGYYSYKWAEVLSSDAFSRFEEEGIFNTQTGRDFLHSILEVGSSKKASEAYEDFRKRPASIDALLRHNGISA